VGEFGERRREAQLWRDVGDELVVAAAKVLHERVVRWYLRYGH
jgi:hypothetical protein